MISHAAHTAQTLWLRGAQNFLDNHYSRQHVLRFDGGSEVAGSSPPHVFNRLFYNHLGQ